MKKRLFTKMLTVFCVIAMSVCGAVGCDSLMGGTNDSASSSKNSSTITPTVSLNASAKELTVGESFTLTATTTPADAEIVWSSSNEAIATVNNGTVVGVSEGTATVTAKNDTATATCAITVKAAPVEKFTVTFKNGETTLKTVELEKDATVSYDGAEPVKEATEEYTYTFKGWSATENGEVLDTLPVVKGDVTYYAVFEEKVVIQVTDFADGVIKYSNNTQEIFLPRGLLVDEVTLEKATLKTDGATDVVVYENDEWAYDAIALTEEELTGNEVGMRNTLVELSDGTFYNVKLYVYAGIINKLSDFPAFFNTEDTEEGIAPNTYGYYIVANDLGNGTEELAFTQTANTDYSATNGFNGVLDGQGHTLKFKLTSGGLVGMVLGNAVIKNLGVIFEDATTTHYGVFGYITNGAPEIRNCYIEQTNNHYKKTTCWGLMARPNNKLRLHNTVVFGNNISMDNTSWSVTTINENSSNAFVVWAREAAVSFGIATNFDEVSTNGALTSDLSVLDSNYWTITDNKPIWITSVESEENEGGEVVTPPAQDNTIAESILYSYGDNQLFLPAEITFSLDETVTITSADGVTVYYQNGAWANTFALTDEEMNANTVGEYDVKIVKGEDVYYATVKSYAGVIDELSDFPKFFNNDPTVNAPVMYGYYIVTKNLGTGEEELAFTQTTMTDYSSTSGFNGVLDGQGYTLKFKLTSGGLVGMVLGNAVIKNLSVIFEDATSTKYGVFGYLTNGAPEIRNCYIQQTNNNYEKKTFWGIMARPNGKLRLHNTVVFGSNIAFDTTWSNSAMNANSSNAFVIWARESAVSFGIATNFTEVSTNGVLTSDLSVLDSNYWNTADNKPSWKQAADKAYTPVACVTE